MLIVLIVVSFTRLHLKTVHFFSFELYAFYLTFFTLFVVILEEDSVSIAYRSHLQMSGLQHTKQCIEATHIRSEVRRKSETRTI